VGGQADADVGETDGGGVDHHLPQHRVHLGPPHTFHSAQRRTQPAHQPVMLFSVPDQATYLDVRPAAA
jgi:hypothetical protein